MEVGSFCREDGVALERMLCSVMEAALVEKVLVAEKCVIWLLVEVWFSIWPLLLLLFSFGFCLQAVFIMWVAFILIFLARIWSFSWSNGYLFDHFLLLFMWVLLDSCFWCVLLYFFHFLELALWFFYEGFVSGDGFFYLVFFFPLNLVSKVFGRSLSCFWGFGKLGFFFLRLHCYQSRVLVVWFVQVCVVNLFGFSKKVFWSRATSLGLKSFVLFSCWGFIPMDGILMGLDRSVFS